MIMPAISIKSSLKRPGLLSKWGRAMAPSRCCGYPSPLLLETRRALRRRQHQKRV